MNQSIRYFLLFFFCHQSIFSDFDHTNKPKYFLNIPGYNNQTNYGYTTQKNYGYASQQNHGQPCQQSFTHPDHAFYQQQYSAHPFACTSPIKIGTTHHAQPGHESYKNHPLLKLYDTQQVCLDDRLMIHYLIGLMSQPHCDSTTELVQTSLQAWRVAQATTNIDQKVAAQKLYKKCYQALQFNRKLQSLAHHAPGNIKKETSILLEQYSTAVDAQKLDTKSNANITHFHRLQQRQHALLETQKELKSCARKSFNYINRLSNDVVGFMLNNNINYASFDAVHYTSIQHCITSELVPTINSSIDTLMRSNFQPIIKQFAYHYCQLAVAAQQLNQLARLQEAVTLTDLAHFFSLYGQFMLDNDQQLKNWKLLSMSVEQGTSQAVYKWYKFIQQFCHDPAMTMHKLSHDCYQIGQTLHAIAAYVSKHTPFAYLDDMTRDMLHTIDIIEHKTNHSLDPQPSRMMLRSQQNLESMQHGLLQTINASQLVIANIMAKPIQENTADLAEFIADGLITHKISENLLALCQFVGNQSVHISYLIQQEIPAHLLDSSIQFLQTNTGELFAHADSTKDNIITAIATAVQKTTDPIKKMAETFAKAKIISDKIKERTQPNPTDIKTFQKTIEPYLRMDKIVDVERLKTIENVEQINNFKKYTNNFTSLEKLTSEEILYLNLCDWLEPRAKKINVALKKKGGITLVDSQTGASVFFDEYDLFHSLLGEMSPGAVADRIKGGHLYIPELKAAILDIGEIEPFGKGFFDMNIKYAGKLSEKYKQNSYFPMGTSVEQAVDMIEEAIKKSTNIKIMNAKNPVFQGFICTNQQGQDFGILAKNKIIQFYPIKPEYKTRIK
jgi:hypothetical protein